jgi:hypothetical protein
MLRRSASSSSISPPKELSHRARSRRHRRGFLAGKPSSPPPNSPPPAILRPSQPHQRVPGELLVRPPPFLLLFSRRSRRHGRPPACLGAGRPGPCPADQASLASNVALRAPLVSCSGSSDPEYKRFLRAYFVSRKFRKMLELVKTIAIYLYVGKMCMTYQNAQKNMLYMFMSNSCMFIQL